MSRLGVRVTSLGPVNPSEIFDFRGVYFFIVYCGAGVETHERESSTLCFRVDWRIILLHFSGNEKIVALYTIRKEGPVCQEKMKILVLVYLAS